MIPKALTRSYAPAVGAIVICIMLAHMVAPDQYNWTIHSISQLAAQGYGQAWLMRAGFILFGALVLLAGAGRIRADRRHWYREAAIMLYGLAILLSGIFSTSSFLDGAPFSAAHARWHTIFATTAGVALSLGILLFALTDRPRSRQLAHLVTLVLITLLSALFGATPAAAGVFQRLLWIVGFGWLVFLGSMGLSSAAQEQ